MRANHTEPDRRRFLKMLAVAGLAPGLPVLDAFAAPALITRAIPSSGERIPVVGMGSWITFNVGEDRAALDRCTAVVKAFLDSGGVLIDSSPMYGSSQATIGYALNKLAKPKVFSADKVWISSATRGRSQIEESRRLWG